ncbi:uncharacterized protein LOC113346964 [Papaver somniferum]|uniref:uncharacterized protein LOC113346964 n=1 Tax=Papaver somniferum TaxID=3469 RepID=UPI000E6F66FC|nr:uncharacterized protein LOC113346964 [Papaver somniferum]
MRIGMLAESGVARKRTRDVEGDVRRLQFELEASRRETESLRHDKRKLEEARKHNAELQRQLDDLRGEKQSLDEELDGMEACFEMEIEDERAIWRQKMRNLHAKYGVKLTNACKVAILRERQRVDAASQP